MGSPVTWTVRWEGGLAPKEHVELAELLARTLGAVRAEDARLFDNGRSWAGGRPEFRLLGSDDSGVVAHMGVLRRLLRIGEQEVLVGDLGLFVVRPDRQRERLGSALLTELRQVMFDLGLPFGFLGCRDELIPFYAGNGWQQLPEGVAVRQVDPRDPLRVISFAEPLFIQPLKADIADWPAGSVIERNGWEV